jgi:hypothetical protein
MFAPDTRCKRCGGKGWVPYLGPMGCSDARETCWDCHGKGQDPLSDSRICYGSVYIETRWFEELKSASIGIGFPDRFYYSTKAESQYLCDVINRMSFAQFNKHFLGLNNLQKCKVLSTLREQIEGLLRQKYAAIEELRTQQKELFTRAIAATVPRRGPP